MVDFLVSTQSDCVMMSIPSYMPHHLMSKGQGAPQQNGAHGSDYPCGPAHRLGIINYLHSESKWWAMSAFISPWPQWGHLSWSPQDTHCGGSCLWICTLPLLHKVGCPPQILVDHPWSGIQPTHTLQQSLQKIPFLHLPFGLVCSQDIFQKKMDQILEECQGCIGIADDITIHGHTEAEHNAHLWNLMPFTCKYGLVFNPQKTHVKAPAVNFFGCLYNAEGVHSDPDKVNAIHALPAPTNFTKLHEFLGMVIYLSPFISGMSTLTVPLHELLKKDTGFTWICTYDATFQHVKDAVVSDTTLQYFDLHFPWPYKLMPHR